MVKTELSANVLDELFQIIQSRAEENIPDSYTASLLAQGREKICQKLGEEGVETIIAALGKDKKKVIYESSDLLFHLLVLWHDVGIIPLEVFKELKSRFGTSGIQEKSMRQSRK